MNSSNKWFDRFMDKCQFEMAYLRKIARQFDSSNCVVCHNVIAL
jgi:hypothetical protein